MKVDLNKNECANAKVALVRAAKSDEANEVDMINLLNLSQKFNWEEKVDKKEK